MVTISFVFRLVNKQTFVHKCYEEKYIYIYVLKIKVQVTSPHIT